MKSILILCRGNSCRSQMAEGFLRSLGADITVFSAGTEPAERVHPMAIRVMSEAGIDIREYRPKSVEDFLGRDFDFLITVCDGAREACPRFEGRVRRRIHIGLPDPACEEGAEEEILHEFRRVRERIIREFKRFHDEITGDSESNAGYGD